MIGTRIAVITDEHRVPRLARVVAVEDGVCRYEFDTGGLEGYVLVGFLHRVAIVERSSFTYRPGDRTPSLDYGNMIRRDLIELEEAGDTAAAAELSRRRLRCH